MSVNFLKVLVLTIGMPLWSYIKYYYVFLSLIRRMILIIGIIVFELIIIALCSNVTKWSSFLQYKCLVRVFELF